MDPLFTDGMSKEAHLSLSLADKAFCGWEEPGILQLATLPIQSFLCSSIPPPAPPHLAQAP